MAIPVSCACGARLKAKDASAGRQLRCPTCQATIAIPPKPPATPEPEWQSVDTSPPTRSPVINKPGLWLPIFTIGVLAAVAVLFLIFFNRPKPPPAARPVAVAVAVPVKPIEKPAKDATEIAREKAIEDRLRSLLIKADLAYAEDGFQIVGIVKSMIDECEKAGLALTPEEALEGSLRWPMPGYFAREKQVKFAEFYAMYLTTRIGHQLSHRQAIRNLHYLSSALDLKSKQATPPEFEAAFESASPGCQLAMAESHNVIRGNDPVAEYYGGLAEQVASAYRITGQEVAAETSFVCVQLQNTSQESHPDQILLAALRWTKLAGGNARPKYLEFLGLYLTLRAKEAKSHAQACEVLCGQRPDDARPEP